MKTELQFPKLGILLELDRVAFSIGNITVYWYGIIVVTGIILGFLYAYSRSNEFKISKDRLTDYVLYSVIAGIIGARIYYVAFSWDFYKNHPEKIIRIWEGGIAIYGGVIGAIIMILVLSKFWKQNPLDVLDCCSGGLILGQAIGRWGNFMNIEAFGANTNLPWGMTSPSITSYLLDHMDQLAAEGIVVDPNVPVHPTFLYESVWNLVCFAILVAITKKRKFKGQIMLMYFGLYGLGRAWIEGLRTDSLMWGNVRVSQLLAVLMVAASFGTILYINGKIKNNILPQFLKLDENAEPQVREETANENTSENKEELISENVEENTQENIKENEE